MRIHHSSVPSLVLSLFLLPSMPLVLVSFVPHLCWLTVLYIRMTTTTTTTPPHTNSTKSCLKSCTRSEPCDCLTFALYSCLLSFGFALLDRVLTFTILLGLWLSLDGGHCYCFSKPSNHAASSFSKLSGVAEGSVSTSQLHGPWFNPEFGIFVCVEFLVFISVSIGFSGILPPPKHMLVGELATQTFPDEQTADWDIHKNIQTRAEYTLKSR